MSILYRGMNVPVALMINMKECMYYTFKRRPEFPKLALELLNGPLINFKVETTMLEVVVNV